VNLASLLVQSSRRAPDADALRRAGRRVGYGDLDRASARVAERLVADGIVAGDRVGLMLPNVPEFAAAYYGILRAGAIAVPLDIDLTRDEIAAALRDVGARRLIAWRARLERRSDPPLPTWLVAPGSFFDDGAAPIAPARLVDRRPDHTAVILYTSGTTGSPKGAELTHANLVRNATVSAEVLGYRPDDAILSALPLSHAFGQTCVLNAAMLVGASVVLVPRFDAAMVARLLVRERITVHVGVPSMYAGLLAQSVPPAAGRLRLCVSGGAPLHPELLARCQDVLGCRMLEGYGLTETSPVAAFNRLDGPSRPGSIGPPVPGVEMRIVDAGGVACAADEAGELLIRGHNVMKGYWQRPEDTRAIIDADGWLHTGDLARVDRDGAYWIVGRLKELIIRNGINVHPREVEEVLLSHPGVREAAVIGVPDPVAGEEVTACVTVQPGAALSVRELLEFVRARIAASKCPGVLWVADELPRTSTGKVIRRELVPRRLGLPEGGGEVATHG